MKNKPTAIEKEKFKGQTKRIWYQKGYEDGRKEAVEKVIDIVDNRIPPSERYDILIGELERLKSK